ncbi:factor-independent urate hydroxylase [Nesterenkonia alkaliphila]|uniref:Uricase n=1 Tax=Nesterenkonia alkaliphila TaxID=1463631 RepID=A0A7K1UJP0_9MICC|nr:urate oxidase [Nesterenkonia alkaliphila]MVT26699.1 urate oxidase [Nesterenkonia alkaliphila]GFZ76856.1 uricase [Nesterenkonia alkaliphila]
MNEIVLGPNQYGKAEVRVVRVHRETEVHQIRDLNVTSFLRGDFAETFLTGDNSKVLATDTQKNTVYAFAKKYGISSPEEFLLTLGRHFLSYPEVHGGRWLAESYPWERITVEGRPHEHSFVRSTQEIRTAAVTSQDGAEYVLGGFKDLTVLKSTGSEFTGFPRDEYTTLPETTDRIMATDISARWLYQDDAAQAGSVDFDAVFAQVKQIVLEQFAAVHSLSLQQTLYAAGSAVLEAVPQIEDIRFAMPNNHHYVVDLTPFGLENPNEVFEAGVLPYGLMNASVTRAGAQPKPAAWQWIPGFV